MISLYFLALHIIDKWLKKSVEVDDDESPINQKKEKSSQSKRRKVVRRYGDTYLNMGLHGMKMKKTRVHDALFGMNRPTIRPVLAGTVPVFQALSRSAERKSRFFMQSASVAETTVFK